MAPSTYEIAIAGLLHDIGKLYQRANWAEKKPHTMWTHSVVLGLSGLWRRFGLSPEDLAHAAAHHHEANPKGWQPQTPADWAVALADNYASNEREESSETQPTPPPQVALVPIFTRLRLDNIPPPHAGSYTLAGFTPENAFPHPKAGLAYTALADHLSQKLSSLSDHPPESLQALLANLNALLYESTWAVPSDTVGEPDVSLYDHLRLTAAFAAALWRYHELVDGEVQIDRLKKEGEDKFLLVLGDMGGIQDHIYRIREAEAGAGSIAKRLRARSLEVALAAETMAKEILDSFGLPFLNRILSAGGRFTLLVPAGKESNRVLEKAAEQWEAWALQNGATLIPTLAWHAFSPATLKRDRFGAIFDAAGQKLREQKLKPFAHTGGGLLSSREVSFRPCPVCDARPSSGQNPDGSWQPCERCQAEAEIGQHLPLAAVIGVGGSQPDRPFYSFPQLYAKPSQPLGFIYRSRLDFSPDPKAFEVRPLTGRIPSVKDAAGLLEESYDSWLKRKGLEGVLNELGTHDQRPLTFEEIAHLSKGAPHLGVLMLDADRMGEVFGRGLRHDDADLRTPSRIATLSRMFELFFGFLSVELMENPEGELSNYLERSASQTETARRYLLIYNVYAGGDDVFLIGPWDALLQYALELEMLYRRFTGGHPDLTLSGGFVLNKPNTPLPLIADRVRKAEKMAKAAGRNRLTVFGHPVEWDALRRLLQQGRSFYHAIEQDELPNGLGHRLLGLWELYRTWAAPAAGRDQDPTGLRYKPLLFYMRRNQGVEKHWEELFKPLMNHEDERMRYLPVWVQYAVYLRR